MTNHSNLLKKKKKKKKQQQHLSRPYTKKFASGHAFRSGIMRGKLDLIRGN